MTNSTMTRLGVALLAAIAAGCASSPEGDVPSAISVACPQAVAAWTSGTAYAVNALVTYHGAVYRCVQAHTALDGWTPDVVPALWDPVQCSSGGAPGGGGMPAPAPAPGGGMPTPAPGGGSSGCSGLTVACPANIPAWAPSVAYATANLVTYQSRVYRCVQSHTSLSTWTPDAVPALWEPVTCAGTTCGDSPTPTPTP
ncbi:MAG TPA: carbohydrate-binding protein, partial [Polyangia bacterium]|nr:carbohydrate-binding protein [Polyangia bacterium]